MTGPRTILVFNCGSSSVGSRLYAFDDEVDPVPIFSAKAHRVGVTGTEPSFLQVGSAGDAQKTVMPLPDHRTAARRIVEQVGVYGFGVDVVGHRFAHGGSAFHKTAKVDTSVWKALQECAPLAPIHNPNSLSVIAECARVLPGKDQYVVFDTAFHSSIPEWVYTYPVPLSVREAYGYRKYGFHGLSYSYLTQAIPSILGRPIEGLKMVACHLGTGGSSVCAIEDGRSLDTSMGYSPLTGLLMSTRSGDVDPLLSLNLSFEYDMRPDDVLSLLTDRSGLLGVAGFSSDLRDIQSESNPERVERAGRALRMYTHRLRKYIGSYVVALRGIDALVFTDDIGVSNWMVREQACSHLGWCGVKLDEEANRAANERATRIISADDSAVKVVVVPTEEELVIARESAALVVKEDQS